VTTGEEPADFREWLGPHAAAAGSIRRRQGWLVMCGACLLTGCGGLASLPPAAAVPKPPPSIPVAECRFASGPILIDGTLDEAAWGQAAVIDDFRMPWEPGGPPARAATRARLLWDADNLYVAADMDDGDLYADVTEHDGNTWDNDVFEVFLKPAADAPPYYEFHVTPANTRFDVFLPRRGHVGRFKKTDVFGIESAVAVRGTLDAWADRDTGWTVEMRIPWADLARTGGRPEAGAEWRFALCRYDFDVAAESPELSTAAPLSRKNFHAHEDYARLRFVGPEGGGEP
jgi:hypothetical protein